MELRYPTGKVLVAVSCLRFSEVPDVLVRLPHLEAALREQSSMALRMGEDLWGLLGGVSYSHAGRRIRTFTNTAFS